LRRAEHLRFGLRERLKLGSQRGIAQSEGGKLRGWECALGFINLRVAFEHIAVTQFLWVLQLWRKLSFDARPRELQVKPWIGDDCAISG
jgi:hypothetical protein